MMPTTMRRRSRPVARRLLNATLAVGATVGLLGCYTVLTHPQISPQEQVTDEGHIVSQNECATCHTEQEMWSFHHGLPYYGLQPSHDSYLWDSFAYEYDSFFQHRSWYRGGYYGRWYSYYARPWWYLAPATAGGSGTPHEPAPPAVGRGDARDGYDRAEPREGFVPLGTEAVPTPRFSAPLVPRQYGDGSAAGRPAEDSTKAVPPSSTREPSRVTPRESPPSPPPPPSQEQPAPASTTQQKQASDDHDDDKDAPAGRGEHRGDADDTRSR